MNKHEALRLRRKAIRDLRKTGMTEQEVAEAVGVSLDELQRISKVKGTPNVPARIANRIYPGDRQGAKTGGEFAPPVPAEGRNELGRSTIQENVDAYNKKLANHPERRCTATSSQTGQQCRKWAVPGTLPGVCKYHGGASKQVRMKARERLDNASDLMAKELLGIATNGASETNRLAAIRDALDRSGIRSPTQVEIGPKPYEEIYDGIASGPREASRSARGFVGEPLPEGFGGPEGFSGEDASRNPVTPKSQGAGLPTEEPLRTPESEDLPDGSRKYRRPAIVGLEAIERANQLRFGEIERG